MSEQKTLGFLGGELMFMDEFFGYLKSKLIWI